jgi:2-polyprenyl-6-methoxyphenol hydroxylase-like FAD-dependent oxidoreductase
MHRQPDNVWRIDLQLGPDADPTAEQEPERVRARLAKVLAPHEFELEWVSIYTFNCRRLDRFVHGRVVFIGDAAHQVSPFGARGANSGIQDAENLAWKLAAVLEGEGGEALIGATTPSGCRRRMRISATRHARPISCRRHSLIRAGGCCAMPWLDARTDSPLF